MSDARHPHTPDAHLVDIYTCDSALAREIVTTGRVVYERRS